ncbi:NF-kappa-B inhibitor delta [Pimephales promelas]|uniref:NF-kappa-B inhibitor delta n=1 Tax=Pimephales promelas TaxID=90988 RepID=UPI0019556D62|nr:NF-kappa-B inhibitor delta [Pimephales promelas]KAG1947604.1 NF-kappa-B inhibitor delta [Pimephales promelas]
MHFQKSPKEKACYPLPTVKKLLEQKRKRETSSAPPSCSTASYTTGGTASVPVCASIQSPTVGTSASYTDMGAVRYDRWEVSSIHQAHSSLQQCNPFSFISSSSIVPNFTQIGQTLATGYSPQQMQDCQDAQTTQQYSITECPVTAAGTDLTGTVPVQSSGLCWPSDSRAEDHTSQYVLPEFRPQMDMVKLQEARVFLQNMDYSRTTWQDDDGDTILHIYTAKGLREYAFAAAEKLRGLGKLDSKEHKGKTALLVAVTANQPDIVQDLLSLGADIGICDVNGQTALHLTATYGFPRVMEVILFAGLLVDLEARNFEGLTPLHCAVISHCATIKAIHASSSSSTWLVDGALESQAEDKLMCLRLLINAGASVLSQEIKSNKTVLHLAVKEGNIRLVRFFLSLQISNMQAFINMKAHGHTALHMAAGLHGSPDQEELIRLLLSRGADPSIRNLENDQPAHLLQSGDKGERLKLILKKKSASSRRRFTSLQDQE